MKTFGITRMIVLALMLFTFACGSGGEKNGKTPVDSKPFVAAPNQSNSNLQFDHLEHNFGVVKRGTKVEHTYRYKNVSAVPVQIIQVHTSCPCMTAEHVKGMIQPGEEGVIKCSFDTQSQNPAKYEKIFAVQISNQQHIPSLWLKGSVVE